MKTINLLFVLVAITFSFSCQKEEQMTKSNTPIPTSALELDENLIYFDIPSDLISYDSSNVGSVEVIEEQVMKDSVYYDVKIECKTTNDGKIISLGVSEDFTDVMDYNDRSFIIDNEDVFMDYYSLTYKSQRGPLGRFFLGRVVNGPCVGGARNWYNDHWLVGTYEGGKEPC